MSKYVKVMFGTTSGADKSFAIKQTPITAKI